MHRDFGLRLPDDSGAIERSHTVSALPALIPYERSGQSAAGVFSLKAQGGLPSARIKRLPPKKTDTVSRRGEREDGVALSAPEKPPDACTPAARRKAGLPVVASGQAASLSEAKDACEAALVQVLAALRHPSKARLTVHINEGRTHGS